MARWWNGTDPRRRQGSCWRGKNCKTEGKEENYKEGVQKNEMNLRREETWHRKVCGISVRCLRKKVTLLESTGPRMKKISCAVVWRKLGKPTMKERWRLTDRLNKRWAKRGSGKKGKKRTKLWLFEEGVLIQFLYRKSDVWGVPIHTPSVTVDRHRL